MPISLSLSIVSTRDTVGGGEPPPTELVPQMFFDHDTENGGSATEDTNNYTYGVVATSDIDGAIDKLFYWKPDSNLQPMRSFGLWRGNELLWSGDSVNEPDGPIWIGVKIDPPVDILSGDFLTVGATTNKTSETEGYFVSPIKRGHLTLVEGRYNAATLLDEPLNKEGGNMNYWLDLRLVEKPEAPAKRKGKK